MGKWPAIALCVFCTVTQSPIRGQGFRDLERRAGEGDAIPELPGMVVERIVEVRSNQAGTLAFTAQFGERDFSIQELKRVGLFRQDQGPPRLLAELADASLLYHLSVNGHGTIAVASSDRGIYIYPQSGSVRHVAPGDAAPVQPAGITFASFFLEADNFLDQNDGAVFVGRLSDDRTGLFRLSPSGLRLAALQGEAVPDRPAAVFGEIFPPYSVRGEMVAFKAGVEVFIDNGSGVRTVLSEDQPLPSGDLAIGVFALALNRSGDVVIASRVLEGEPQLTMFTGEQAIPVLDDTTGPPGFQGSRSISSTLYLDDSDRLYFGVTTNELGGIFRWSDGTITKIAADGDRGPTGGVLQVSFDCVICPFPPPMLQIQSFRRPNALGQVAFEASDSLLGFRPFLWTDGVIDLVDFLPASPDGRLLLSLSLLGVEEDGSVLTRGNLCCGPFSKDIYQATLAPRRLVLPYLAAGEAGGLRIDTSVELSNVTPYPLTTSFNPVSQPEALFNPPPTGPMLSPGAFAEIPSRRSGPLGSGFAVIETEGGGLANVNGSIRLERGVDLISLVNLPASPPLRQARLVVDQSGPADTGVALTNPSESPIDVRATLSDRDGGPAGEAELHLEAGDQISRFATDLFPQASEPGFLGSLEIESLSGEDDFVLAGLRQSQLRLSALPSLPPPSAAPRRNFSGYLATGALQFVRGHNGAAAILERPTPGGQFAVRVITPEGIFPVLDQDTVLPGGDSPAFGAPPAVLIDLNEDLELLFAVQLDSGKVGLFLWKDAAIQRLLVSGDEVDGYPVTILLSPDAYSRNKQGMIAAGGLQVVVFDPFPRLLLTADTPIRLGDSTIWGYFQAVQLDEDGTVYFMSYRFLGRSSGPQIEVLAENGRALLSNPATAPVSFREIRLARPGELLVSFSALDNFRQLGVLVRYSEGAFQGVLAPGQSIVGLPDVEVELIDAIRVNSAGEALARALVAGFSGGPDRLVYLRIPTSGQPSLIAAPAEAGQPGFPQGAEFNFLGCLGDATWSDDGLLLLYACDRQGGGAAFLIGPSGTVKLVGEGDIFSHGPNGQTILVSRVNGVNGFGPDGAPLLDVLLEDGHGLGDAILTSLGQDSQEIFVPLVSSGQTTGIRLESRLLLSNPGETASALVLQPTTKDGRTLPAIEVELRPKEVRAVLLEPDEDFRGWMRVRSRGGIISIQERISLFQAAKLVAEATIPQSSLRTRGVIDTRFASAARTGLAIVNPWTWPVAVNLRLDTGDPETSRTERMVLEPESQRSQFIAEIFRTDGVAGAPEGLRSLPDGIVRIESDAPVAMIALRQEGLVFTTQAID